MANVKNYTEQGGEKTVIGGTLEIREGASVTGLPSLENQASSTAADVAGLVEDFNALLTGLKDTGYMASDAWNLSVVKIAQIPASDPNADKMTVNQDAVSDVSIADGIITITADMDSLQEFPSSVAAQGTHLWIGILITAGLSDITQIKYNGVQLTSGDATEAATCGGSAGDIVMWIKADEVAVTPKRFTLWAPGYAVSEFTVVIAETVQE